MLCPRRIENPSIFNYPDSDEWRSDGTCSYCGSISPEKFFEAIADSVEIGPTDKSYKVYVKLPGFAKFYFQHLTDEGRDRFIKLHNSHVIKIGYPGHFYKTPFFCKKVSESDL
jgi:hypothetical protein